MRRKQLREDLESKSAKQDEQVKRAFDTALAMQKKAEDEASAIKAELEHTTQSGREEIEQLTEQASWLKRSYMRPGDVCVNSRGSL